ncbi:hypothetical protein LYZ96_22865, partial [Xanthomonas hortorum pv. vitians]|uniref:hypothetical protein n=1 Tax=Xanthomonas hortorum TaxID=56454 RepID=UPI001F412B1B
EDLPASLLALAQALSVTERQLHGSLLNMGVVSLICGALFRGSLETRHINDARIQMAGGLLERPTKLLLRFVSRSQSC